MAQVINTNISSLNAQRNLTTSQNSLATSLQRLSSGLRINSAKDDAAGLAITDRMTSQIRGLNQAARNANDGVSLAQTAEGGLAEVGNNLQRIRELAIQSANATNTASDRASLQSEVTQLLAEIQRVSTTTQFNGQNILDGTFSAAQFQVGANANQTIVATTGNSQTSAIGSYQATGATAVTSSALASGDLLINGTDVGVSTSGSAESKATAINAISTLTGVTASASTETTSTATLLRNQTLQAGDLVINGVNVGAIAGSNNIATQGANIAAAINAVSNQTGVTATSNLATGALTLNSATGKDIAITSTTGNAGAQRLANATGLATVSGTPTASTNTVAFANGAQGRNDVTFVTDVADAQDGVTFTLQGRTYELDSGGGVTGSNIAIAFTTADTAATIAGLVKAQLDTDISNGDLSNITTAVNGADVRILSDVMTATTSHTDVTTTLSTTYGVAAAGAAVGNTLNVGGVTYEFGFAGATPSGSNVLVALAATDAGLGTNFAAAVNAQYTALNTNIQASGTATVTLTSDLLGSGVTNLAVTEVQTGGTANAVVGGTATAGTDGTSTGITGRGTLELNSASQYILTGNDTGKAGLAAASVQLTSLSSLSILTVEGANQAISLVDGALSQVASIRGNMGALQNRFQSVVGSLTASSENLSAARSRIQDADFAAETANLTRAQILQQAGVAMLAQANALPNNVLTLLRG